MQYSRHESYRDRLLFSEKLHTSIFIIVTVIQMSPPSKVLLAVSGVKATHPEYPEGEIAGLFITEALHPFNVFTAAGFEVDFVSESGTYYADWFSLTPDFLKGADKETFENKDSPFRKALDAVKKPSEYNAGDYGIFFAAGGHTALLDFPTASGLLKAAGDIYKRGGVVAAVCHGSVILGYIKNPETNENIIKGKKATGFTVAAEEELKVLDFIRKEWKKPLVVDAVEAAGGIYVNPPGNWDDFVVADGKIVSGVNPQSATSTAKGALKAFES